MPTKFSISCWQCQEFKQDLLIFVFPLSIPFWQTGPPPSLREHNPERADSGVTPDPPSHSALLLLASLTFQLVCTCSASWVPSFVFGSLAWVCCALDSTLYGQPHLSLIIQPFSVLYEVVLLSHDSGKVIRCSQLLASVPQVTGPQQELDVCVLEWDWAMLWARLTEEGRWCRKIRQVQDSKRVCERGRFSKF